VGARSLITDQSRPQKTPEPGRETVDHASSQRRSAGGARNGNVRLGVRREGDSPEILCSIVLFDKLDSVSGNPLKTGQLRDDAGGNLSAWLILHDDDRANQQLTIQLDSRSIPIQFVGSGGHRKGTLLLILARQPYANVDGDPTAPALRYLTAIDGCLEHYVWTMASLGLSHGFRVHADVRR